MTDVTVYDRYRLGPGATLQGPAIVEERESTTVIGPGAAVGRCRRKSDRGDRGNA